MIFFRKLFITGCFVAFLTSSIDAGAVTFGSRLLKKTEIQPQAANAPKQTTGAPVAKESILRLIAEGSDTSQLLQRLKSQGIYATPHGQLLRIDVRPSQLSMLPGPESVSLDLGKRLFPLLDISAPFIGIDSSLRSKRSGRDVLVAILDTGIDWQHHDFRHDDGSTRFVSYWDQTAPPNNEGEFGVVCVAMQMNAVLLHEEKNACPNNADDNELGFASGGHGTHVAGIAAGSHATYQGIAPEAMLIGVRIFFDEAALIDALAWVQQLAALYQKPVVVNLSLGSNDGGHDGYSASEQVIDDLSGPGFVVVAAAGNEKGQAIHVHAPAAATESRSRFETNSLARPEEFHLEIWTDHAESFSTGLALVKDSTSAEEILDQTSLLAYDDITAFGVTESVFDGEIEIAKVNFFPQETLDGVGVRFTLTEVDASLSAYSWHLVWRSPGSPVDAWLTDRVATFDTVSGPTTLTFSDGELNQTVLFFPGDVNQTVTLPGTAREAIAVTGFVSRKEWPTADGQKAVSTRDSEIGELLDIASIGPTRDGRTKPDIAAPGEFVVSSLAATLDGLFVADAQQPDMTHWVLRGTSMAGPHVAGVAALLLQGNDQLTPDEIKDVLSELALEDSDTGTIPNDLWGQGKLSVQDLPSTSIWRNETRNDLTAPLITDLAAKRTSYGAVLTWTSSELSDSAVEAAGEQIRIASFSHFHEIRLDGKLPGSVSVVSTDPHGNSSAAMTVSIPREGCGCTTADAGAPLIPMCLLVVFWCFLRQTNLLKR